MSEFFFTRVTDPDWGTYFDPTVWAYVLIALIGLLLLFLIPLFSKKRTKKFRSIELAYSALAMALAYITSTYIKLWHMPMGGSITLFSMLFITLIGYWFGLRTGLITAVAYGMLQLVTNPWIISLPQLFCDYIFAFGALGLSGIFYKKKNGLILGYLTGVLGRFFFSFLSGILFFASSAASYNMNAPLYSLLYNGAYIGGEALLTVALLLLPPVKNAIRRIGQIQ